MNLPDLGNLLLGSVRNVTLRLQNGESTRTYGIAVTALGMAISARPIWTATISAEQNPMPARKICAASTPWRIAGGNR
jgi:hypothetical protein